MTTSTDQIARRAAHVAQVAQDTWTLGAITATSFREVTEQCLAAVRDLADYGDPTSASAILDDAEALLDHVS